MGLEGFIHFRLDDFFFFSGPEISSASRARTDLPSSVDLPLTVFNIGEDVLVHSSEGNVRVIYIQYGTGLEVYIGTFVNAQRFHS